LAKNQPRAHSSQLQCTRTYLRIQQIAKVHISKSSPENANSQESESILFNL